MVEFTSSVKYPGRPTLVAMHGSELSRGGMGSRVAPMLITVLPFSFTIAVWTRLSGLHSTA
jgi:hypothetical protein